MQKDDILQALRLTAMGRYGHDLQVQLAEKLEAVFAAKAVEPVPTTLQPEFAAGMTPEEVEQANAILAAEADVSAKLAAIPVKRGPGRPKKAD